MKNFFVKFSTIILLICMCISSAFAQNSYLSVRDIDINSTGISFSDAKNNAINDAIKEGVKKVLERIRYPENINTFFAKYNISNPLMLVKKMVLDKEHGTEDNFSATFNITFNTLPFEEVAAEHSHLTVKTNRKILLIPYYSFEDSAVLWGKSNLWMGAWDNFFIEHDERNFMLPIGEIDEIETLTYHEVVNIDVNKILTFLERYEVENVVVTSATFSNGVLTTSIQPILDDTHIKPQKIHYELPGINKGDSNVINPILSLAVEDMYQKIHLEQEFERIYSDNIYSIAVKQLINNYQEYRALKKKFNEMKFEKEPELIELTPQHALWKLSYKKEITKFISFLYKGGIILDDNKNNWYVSLVE